MSSFQTVFSCFGLCLCSVSCVDPGNVPGYMGSAGPHTPRGAAPKEEAILELHSKIRSLESQVTALEAANNSLVEEVVALRALKGPP